MADERAAGAALRQPCHGALTGASDAFTTPLRGHRGRHRQLCDIDSGK